MYYNVQYTCNEMKRLCKVETLQDIVVAGCWSIELQVCISNKNNLI